MPEKNKKSDDQENVEADISANEGEEGNLPDDAKHIEEDIEALRQESTENKDRLLRLAAEFENYKKRMERERDLIVKYAGENILRELLSTIDNLDRALEQGNADIQDVQKKLDGMVEGVDLTRKGLLATLERFDVFSLDSEGKEFDPNEHEALTMEASDKVPANHVSQVFLKGYRFKDRLLRPAKVVVSKGSE